METENLIDALTSAISYIENSLDAFAKKNEEEVAKFVWKTAAELEYLLFLFALLHENKTIRSWKLDPLSKNNEIGQTLISILNLIKEAKNSLEGKKISEAYKEIWKAKRHLTRIYDYFEKRQSKASV